MVSKRRAIIERWLEGFKPFTKDSVARYRSEDASHVVVPPSTGTPWNNEQTRKFFAQWDGVVKDGTQDVQYWLEDDKANSLAIWTKCTFTFVQDIEPYVGTYLLIFDFDDAQEQITRFVEFIDTGTTKEIIEKVCKGREMLGKGPLEAP